MPAPPSNLSRNCLSSAAPAMRPASAMGSSSGEVTAGTSRSSAFDLDDDRLQVGHLLQREASADATDAALLAGAAAERQVSLPVVGRLVDVDPTGLETIREAEGAREVFCVNRAEQPIWRVVGEGESLLLIAELDDRGDRAERLLLAHPHRRLDAVQDGRVVVEAGRKAICALAAEDQLGALLDRVRDVLVHLCRNALVVQRPERRLRCERITEAQRAGGVRQARHELVAD